MADAPSSMIDFLMRTISKLEADVALKDARIRELRRFCGLRRDRQRRGLHDRFLRGVLGLLLHR